MKILMSQSPLSLIAVIQYIQVIGVFQQVGLENSSNPRKSSQIDSHLPGGVNNCVKTRGRVCQLSIALIVINN